MQPFCQPPITTLSKITKQRISPNRVFDFCQMIQTRFIALATQYDSSAKPISISIGNYPASWKRVITE
ncbi:hypothetical protein GHT06_013807 [Daphnia sinensis]|uniref:Uncharacterized protein n=1 Tax=Daphnia sinensis TaxID=1820382 RepID=A0AAD5PY96_9CRUS|nr:hypothetical protein GHT06_013807 [Daphnia sinensis]